MGIVQFLPSDNLAHEQSRVGSEPIECIYGHELLSLPAGTRNALLAHAFDYWRRRGFPYPKIDRSLAVRELCSLMKIEAEDLPVVLRRPSMVGLRLANAFHPKIWEAKVRGRSPLDSFNCDEILWQRLSKAPQMWPERKCWSAQCVRMTMGLQNRSRVANFRPTVARALIARYAGEGNVLDFAAGFGGRLLGALTLPIRYTGIDPAAAQVLGLRRLASYLRNRAPGCATLLRGPAEILMKQLKSGSFDLIFSSPPYFNLEKYGRDRNQSHISYPKYQLWVEFFLSAIFKQAHRLLKGGGRFAINVANTSGYSIADHAEEIGESIFGQPERTLYMRMSTNPADKARSGRIFRTEPIFVFTK